MAQQLTKNDELNNLRSIPYDKYFGEMLLSPTDKRRRIQLAKRFESFFDDLLFLLVTLNDNEIYDWGFVEAEYYNKIIDMFDEPLDLNRQIYFKKLIKQVIETTVEHKDEPYYTSHDRAKFIAENEANTYYNYDDFQTAIISGMTVKTWHTMNDLRVRMTHEIVDGTEVYINEPFIVGASQMMFPKDTSLGASPDEYVNCRCSVTYSKG